MLRPDNDNPDNGSKHVVVWCNKELCVTVYIFYFDLVIILFYFHGNSMCGGISAFIDDGLGLTLTVWAMLELRNASEA